MLIIKDDIKRDDFEDLDVVKQYFNRIFTVLDATIRGRLKELNVSEEKKKIVLKELAFLSETKQTEYLDELFIIWDKITEE